ncbi:MAG: transcription antitermination factor NusB [Methylophilaceae bacterium]|jgi:N utilization substance protein B|nr:transcription antitermination factor NusB [Methylophilaceae bacterium]NCV27474.1 transcription antitermination factor NusB [Nitrosomonadales bacterium]NCV38572.1 transcription antitermination factor NusB [Betaproteobacteria bacterium]NCV53601.1 transcription antitermination factor NusB [Betaproteobacteria bacterium]NCW62725.1 transcription antitermination factor NusB [Betaproteobacteria bacterium]
MKKINSRRKSRELVMKSIYRGLMNAFDYDDIKKDILEDPDYCRCDEEFYNSLIDGIKESYQEIIVDLDNYIDKKKEELNPIELSILIVAYYELKTRLDIPFKVSINEALEITKSFGGQESFKFINGSLDKLARKYRALEIS